MHRHVFQSLHPLTSHPVSFTCASQTLILTFIFTSAAAEKQFDTYNMGNLVHFTPKQSSLNIITLLCFCKPALIWRLKSLRNNPFLYFNCETKKLLKIKTKHFQREPKVALSKCLKPSFVSLFGFALSSLFVQEVSPGSGFIFRDMKTKKSKVPAFFFTTQNTE